MKSDKGGQTLPDGADSDARFFDFTKWLKIAKMTPNVLLTLKMVFTEPLRKTEQNALLVS